MLVKYLLPAVAAIGSAAAQCTQPTATINAPADATGLSSCSTFKGSIVVNTGASGQVDLTGIQQISGDLIAQNNGVLTSLSSSTLQSIGGSFTLTNLTGLSNLQFTALSSVGSIVWQSLTALDTLTFGTPGVTTAKNIEISDTFLSSLDGIDVTSVQNLNINNNHRLSEYTTQLQSLSNIMILQANGLNLKVEMPKLLWIANMSVANVSSFDVPSLNTVNGSARFDSNYFASFNAPNLTSTKSGDISFIGNAQLTNITMPLLTAIGGGLLIANNTKLTNVNGFGALKQINGAVKLRGNFTNIEFPALSIVHGAFDISSTNDITNSCNTFSKHAPTKQGGDNEFEGTFTCTSNNQNANSDTNSTSTGTGSGTKNAASGYVANSALFGLAVIGGLVALL